MEKFAALFVIIGASLWGVDGIVLRPSLYTLPVQLVVFIETSLATVLLTPFFIKNFGALKKLAPMDWLSFLAVALFGGAIGTMAITKALFYVNFVNLSIVVLIQKLQPVFAISLAALLLKERLPRVFFIWAGIALIGAYIMTFGFHLPNWYAGNKTAMAVLYAMIATISFASSTVFSKRALKNVEFKMGTYLRFSLTALMMLIIVALSQDFSKVADITSRQAFIFALIVFSSGAPAIFLYYYGLKHITASVATIAELAFPLTAIVLEYFVHGNMLSIVQWFGVGILLFSIIRVGQIQNLLKTQEAG